MMRRWVPAVVLLGVLAGCGSPTPGRGTPEAAPTTGTGQGLPVPDDRGAEPTTTGPTATAPTTTAPAPVTTAPRTTPAARPCPADVAATLPGAGPATLVAGYRTARYRLYLCRTAGGSLYYRGISRADAARATTIPARAVAGGWEASAVDAGHTYAYRVTPRLLTVTRDGRPLFTDPVTAAL